VHVPRVLLWLSPIAADLDIVCTAMPQVNGACSLSFSGARLEVALRDARRDALWPRTAGTFVALGIVLTLLATQHISPSRRIRLRRRRRRVSGGSSPASGILPDA
jgi:hypothetical protein